MVQTSRPTKTEYPTSRAVVKRANRKRRPMLYVDSTLRRVMFRTRLLRNFDRALRFARMIEANTRFQATEVVRSNQALTPSWFVAYLPTSTDRQEDLRGRLQAERVKRCAKEMGSYVWEEIPGGPFAEVVTLSGNRYRVGPESCTCDDAQTRCQAVGIYCKHTLAYNIRIGEGDPFAED